MSRRQSIYMNYRASREKLGRPPIKDHRWKQTFLRWHLFETPINSKTTDGLLINLTRSPRKKDARGHPTPSEIASFCPPPPLWISVALRGQGGGGGGEGMDIFWNYTFWFDNFATVNHVTISYPVHSRVPFVSLFLSQLPSVYLLSR